jgi:hypothetical protein
MTLASAFAAWTARAQPQCRRSRWCSTNATARPAPDEALAIESVTAPDRNADIAARHACRAGPRTPHLRVVAQDRGRDHLCTRAGHYAEIASSTGSLTRRTGRSRLPTAQLTSSGRLVAPAAGGEGGEQPARNPNVLCAQLLARRYASPRASGRAKTVGVKTRLRSAVDGVTSVPLRTPTTTRAGRPIPSAHPIRLRPCRHLRYRRSTSRTHRRVRRRDRRFPSPRRCGVRVAGGSPPVAVLPAVRSAGRGTVALMPGRTPP